MSDHLIERLHRLASRPTTYPTCPLDGTELDLHFHGGADCPTCGNEFEVGRGNQVLPADHHDPQSIAERAAEWPDTIPWVQARNARRNASVASPFAPGAPSLDSWHAASSPPEEDDWTPQAPEYANDSGFAYANHKFIWSPGRGFHQWDVPHSDGLPTHSEMSARVGWHDYNYVPGIVTVKPEGVSVGVHRDNGKDLTPLKQQIVQVYGELYPNKPIHWFDGRYTGWSNSERLAAFPPEEEEDWTPSIPDLGDMTHPSPERYFKWLQHPVHGTKIWEVDGPDGHPFHSEMECDWLAGRPKDNRVGRGYGVANHNGGVVHGYRYDKSNLLNTTMARDFQTQYPDIPWRPYTPTEPI